METILFTLYTFIGFLACESNEKPTIVFIPTDINITSSTVSGGRAALRYGFHKTADCNSFEKSFLCIEKCVDLNYDVAYADKNCRCTCYIKSDMAKYRPLLAVRPTRWRLGAPTTSIPAWAHPKNKNKNLNIDDDSSNESIETDPVISGTPDATDTSVTENETIMKMITEISNHDTSQNRSGNEFMTTTQILNTSEVASQTFSSKGVMTTTQIPNTSEVASQTYSSKGVMTTAQIPNISETVTSVNNTR